MELFEFKSLREFGRSMTGFYAHDKSFKDNKSATLGIVCNPRGAFFKNSVQKMIGVRKGGIVLCQCVLIKHRDYDALTVSFFEAAPGSGEAVAQLMRRAEALGLELGCKRLEISLDGHCNYGVGFSAGAQDLSPMFGESYNPLYYHDYFADGFRKIDFTSHRGPLDEITQNISALVPRIRKRAPDITLACADFDRFAHTMRRYTDLCNAVFAGHRYCFARTWEEDLELFQSMKPLLKPCNLIFADFEGKDIGFVLFYPDFNELVPRGKGAGAGTWVRHRFLNQKIRTIKIAEIGVLPQHRASGSILLLFAEAANQIKRCYKGAETVVSSWILKENIPSGALTARFATQIHKEFSAYEKDL